MAHFFQTTPGKGYHNEFEGSVNVSLMIFDGVLDTPPSPLISRCCISCGPHIIISSVEPMKAHMDRGLELDSLNNRTEGTKLSLSSSS